MSRRAVIAVVAGAAVAAGAALLVLGSAEEEPEDLRATIAARRDSLVLLDLDEGRPLGDVALGVEPSRLAYGEGAFWVAAPEDGLVMRVDEQARTATRFIVGEEPYDVAVGGGAVWVPDHDLQRLLRLDPESGAVRRTEDLGAPAISVGYGFGSVWLVVASGDLLRIDPETLEVESTEPRLVATAENAEPKLVFRDGTLWISSPASGSLVRIDGAGGAGSSTETVGILSVTASDDGIWFSQDTGHVQRLDGEDRVAVGTRPLDLASNDGALWVAAYDDKAAKRVDTGNLRVTGEVRLGRSPVAVAAGSDVLAVAVQAD
jgi:streptogramin lyase